MEETLKMWQIDGPRIMVPHFPAIGSGGMPPLPPTILLSDLIDFF